METPTAPPNTRDAEAAGSQAFSEGKHRNPHDFEREPALFRAWCRGYKAARDYEHAMYGEAV